MGVAECWRRSSLFDLGRRGECVETEAASRWRRGRWAQTERRDRDVRARPPVAATARFRKFPELDGMLCRRRSSVKTPRGLEPATTTRGLPDALGFNP